MEIKRLEELIESNLKVGQRFLSYECKNLLPAGENYGSVMLQVKIKTLNEKGYEEIIDCVGKTCPPLGFLWEVFNTKISFKKEIAVYNTVIPILNEFGKEKGIDRLMSFIANSLGARISLDASSNEVDTDAVLLLENLKIKGYDIGDRFNGFDEESTKLLLTDLAVMHAAPIAFKNAKPNEFKEKILPHLSKHVMVDSGDEMLNRMVEKIQSAISLNSDCVPHLHKIEEAFRRNMQFLRNPSREINEIFATITHNDFWVNNTMIKYENDKPIDNKIVDFQIVEYNSLAHDVIFFIFSSVQLSVLENQLDDLMKFYYNKFIETLNKLGGNTNAYTFEAMKEEFANVASNQQYSHLTFMLTPMMTLRGEAKELSELQIADIVNQNALHENYYKRIQFVFLEFVNRGWI